MFNYSKDYFHEPINRLGTNSCKHDIMFNNYNDSTMIPLSVADMDFRAPIEVIESLKATAEHGIYGYSFCDDEYFKIVVDWIRNKYSIKLEENEIIFSSRIVQAISAITQIFTTTDQEVLIFSPGYSPVKSAITVNNRKVVNIPLCYKNNKYSLDIDNFKSQINEKTKMLVLINPHNPTGRVWSYDELLEICNICTENNILIISDEIHADFIRPGHKFTSVASLSDEIANKCIDCTSPSKTFNFPGLHVCNIIVKNEALREKVIEAINTTMVHEPNIFAVPAVKVALQNGDNYLKELLNYIENNICYVKDTITKHMPDLTVVESQGTYLMWIDYSKTNLTEDDILDWTTNNSKVNVYLGSNFGDDGIGFIRLNLASPFSVIEEAMKRLIEHYPCK